MRYIFVVLLVCIFLSYSIANAKEKENYHAIPNAEIVKMDKSESIRIEDFVSRFMTKVQNQQFSAVADNFLKLPKKTYQGKPLSADQKQQIKDDFVKNLKSDYQRWKKAEISEIRCFRVKNSRESAWSEKVYLIFVKIKGEETVIHGNIRYAPFEIAVSDIDKNLVIENIRLSSKSGCKSIPVYPNSVWPLFMD